ncbi:MAG: site-specific DNA-methyltransferase [Pseudomonadota bacterium]
MSGHQAGAHHALQPILPIDSILVGDALEQLATLPPGSVDAAFADPPYNLQLSEALLRPNQTRVDGVDAAWDQFDDFEAYDRFTRAWLALVRRALKPNGTLWVIGSYHNIFRVGTAVQDTGFWVLNDVVWVKTNPMPNFRGRRFTNAHETLIWAVADKRRTDYCFNYRSLKTFNDDLQHRSDWTLPLCIGGERLRDASGGKAHPTQKPEALLHRILLASTRPGDVVLDPFFGTGTTGAVARRLGRHFIGIEQDEDYASLAEARIAGITPHADTATVDCARRQPRIPFGMLVEAGRIKVGEELVAGRSGPKAKVRADGSLLCGEHEGSIHKVGALVRNTSACNGWTFWHIEGENGALVAIDQLRQTLRRDMAA